MTPIEQRALELWREREMDFPPRVRRMNPDALDMATGAWASCLAKAMTERRACEAKTKSAQG